MTVSMAAHADATANTSTVSSTHRKRSLRHSFKIRLIVMRKRTQAAILYGLLSAALYFMLYTYSGDIRHIAEMTNQGDKTFFLLPIAIAFVFSFAHGVFTDRFWEAMGLKAKR